MNQHANVTAAPLMTDSSLTNGYVRVLFTRVICFALLRYTIRFTKKFASRLIQAENRTFVSFDWFIRLPMFFLIGQ